MKIQITVNTPLQVIVGDWTEVNDEEYKIIKQTLEVLYKVNYLVVPQDGKLVYIPDGVIHHSVVTLDVQPEQQWSLEQKVMQTEKIKAPKAQT